MHCAVLFVAAEQILMKHNCCCATVY